MYIVDTLIHWLPVRSRIVYKICLLIFKGLNGYAPAYISDFLNLHTPTRSLRSAGQNLLVVRRYRLEQTWARAFQNAAPKVWNDLPVNLRNCTELGAFKSSLKTHLFTLFLSHNVLSLIYKMFLNGIMSISTCMVVVFEYFLVSLYCAKSIP